MKKVRTLNRAAIARGIHYDAGVSDPAHVEITLELSLRNFYFSVPSAKTQLSRHYFSFPSADVCCDEPVRTHYVALAYTRFIIDCISSLSTSSVLCNKQNNKNATVLTASRATKRQQYKRIPYTYYIRRERLVCLLT